MNDRQDRSGTEHSQSLLMTHRWLSNPLDWRPVDRFILLAGLSLLSPILFGAFLVAGLLITPAWLDPAWSRGLLVMYALHAAGLLWLLGMAFMRRARQADWPLMENFIIVSFVATTLVGSYVTGTHFTMGLLLIFLGINITSALANVRKIYAAYLVVCAVMAAFVVLDLSGAAQFAPLFAKSPLRPDGAPLIGWLVLQVTLAAILLMITHITFAAIKRWVDRESLYRDMSTIDGLTRLTSRRSFIERSQNEFSRAQRRPDTHGLACIMIDLDHFKRINDTWGHHAGDAVLVAASSILMESKRPYDEVGRYGGEEFAILLPGITFDAAVAVAERIRAGIAAAVIEVDNHQINITASFGVSHYPSADITNLNELLKAADRALYMAKDAGRNRVVAAYAV